MKYYLIILCLIFSLVGVKNKYLSPFSERSQNNNHTERIQDTIMFTSGGPALISNIHYIDNKHHLNINGNRLQIVESRTGLISQEFKRYYSQNEVKNADTKTYSQQITSQANSTNSDFKDGWTTYAYCNNKEINPVTSFSTKWIVPQPPEN